MESRVRGKIVEWDQSTGRGFVETGGQRLPLYATDMVDRVKPPATGDSIIFQIESNQRGEARVRDVWYASTPGRITGGQLLFLFVLLIAPALAMVRLATPHRIAIPAGAAAVLSLVTYLVYSVDKRRARAGGDRVPESTLHLCALLGGWPGAFLGQRWLRHKTSKLRFQLVYWLIVAGHEYLAIDYLIGWQLRDSLWLLLRPAA